MLTTRIALTSLTDQVSLDDVTRVAAALQTQVSRDFAPSWHTPALICAAPFGSIPYGMIPVMVRELHAADGENGFHRKRDDDTPYVIVPYGPSWSLAASHMVLRMLADPCGSARVPGASPLPGQGTVEYLVDCCGPCQDVDAGYQIDGVVVSDFCLPSFYAGAPVPHGSAVSFTGSLTEPLSVGAGGVTTWFADDGLLYQARGNHKGVAMMHGGFSAATRGRRLLREYVDQLTPSRFTRLAHAPLTRRMAGVQGDARRACLAHHSRLRDELAWRFAPDPVGQATLRQAAAAGGYARSGQQRDSADVATTERTAS